MPTNPLTMLFPGTIDERYAILCDGEWWIAVNPILSLLNVSYAEWMKKAPPQKMRAGRIDTKTFENTNGEKEELLCINEYLLYGWLLAVPSANEQHRSFQKESHKVLYKQLGGSITGIPN